MSEHVEFGSLNYTRVAVYLVFIVVVYYSVIQPIYSLWFHPLAKYPGPKLRAISHIPWALSYASGKSHIHLSELHERYGKVVRICPDELSYIAPEAWEYIMGRRKHGNTVIENRKAPWFLDTGAPDIITAPTVSGHTRQRRLLSHGFSTAAMLQQESFITGYVDLLIQRLHEKSQDGQSAVDMCAWYNYCTFDLIGDLAFGEPFGSLKESTLHPWITLVLSNLQANAIGAVLNRFRLTRVAFPYLVPKKIKEQSDEFKRLASEKVGRRLAIDGSRADFIENMISGKGGTILTRQELDANAILLTLAGSETSATAMTAATYLLAKHPEAMQALMKELSYSFSEEREINMISTAHLSYLSAVIQESLRLFPPAANAQPRLTPPEGNTVLGERIPGNIILGIPQWSTYTNESNFKRPEEFIPERWLNVDDPKSEFYNDKRSCMNPFSCGPRNCIGMNLAYAEMRLILARVLWNFEPKIAKGCENWMEEQPSYILWDRSPLYMHLFPRKQRGV